MTLDHASDLVGPPAPSWFRLVGRLAMPLFCYAAAYGAVYLTTNRPGQWRRLFGWALVAQPVYVLAFDRHWWQGSVLFTLGLGVLALDVLHHRPKDLQRGEGRPTRPLRLTLALTALAVASVFGSYPVSGVILVAGLGHWFITRHPAGAAAAMAGLVTLNGGTTVALQLATLVAVPLVLLLHGGHRVPHVRATERATPPRSRDIVAHLWYAYYPAHLLAGVLLARLAPPLLDGRHVHPLILGLGGATIIGALGVGLATLVAWPLGRLGRLVARRPRSSGPRPRAV